MPRELGRDAVRGYVWLSAYTERSSGPERTATAKDGDPPYERKPVLGFVAPAPKCEPCRDADPQQRHHGCVRINCACPCPVMKSGDPL